MANGLSGDRLPVLGGMLTTSGPKRMACYLRVSTSDQGESGLGIESQRQRCMDYARIYDMEIVEFYEEHASAKDLDRPILRKAMNDIRGGKADGLLVAKLDRLTRSVKDFLSLVDESVRDGWAVVLVAEKFESTGTGRLMITIIAAFAEFERAQISERTKSAMGKARKDGLYTGGILPPGVALDAAPGGHRRLVPGEHADVVRKIWPMAIGGQSLNQIAEWLNEKINGKYNASTLKQLLASDYCRDAGLVSLEDQRAALEAISSRGNTRTKRLDEHSYISDLVRCPSCRGGMTSYLAKKRYPYLKCHGKSKGKCSQKDIAATHIEDAVDDFLVGCFRQKLFVNRWKAAIAAQRQDAARFRANLVDAEQDLAITEAGIRAIAATTDPTSPTLSAIAKAHDAKLLAARRRVQAAREAVAASAGLREADGEAIAGNIPAKGPLSPEQAAVLRKWAKSCLAGVALKPDGSILAIFASTLADMAAAQGGGPLQGVMNTGQGGQATTEGVLALARARAAEAITDDKKARTQALSGLGSNLHSWLRI